MQDVTEHFRGSGFKVFAGMIEKDPKARVWAIPAPGGGSPRLLRPHERLGAGRGPAGPRLHLLARVVPRPRRGGRRPDRQEPRAGARRSDLAASSSALKDGDAVFFAAGNPDKFYKFAGEARTQDRRAS